MTTAKRNTIIIATLAIAGVGAWVAWPLTLPPSEIAPNAAPTLESATRVAPSASAESESPPEAEASTQPEAGDLPLVLDGEVFSEKLENTLAIYKAEMVYPPSSRPADGSMPHLIDWNRETKVGQPFAADSDGKEIEAHMVLDHSFAGPGETLTARIESFRTEDHTPVIPDRLRVRIEAYGGDAVGWETVSDVPAVSVRSIWEARFTPSQISRLSAVQRSSRVVARVEYGEFYKELPLAFRYAATPALIVLGKASDHVVDGSLAVQFGVDVRYAEPTLVQAVLSDATGAIPIATYSDWFRPTTTGPQSMTISFFGKVLRDANVAGPYRVRWLHGVVEVPKADPREVWWGTPEGLPMMTAAYEPSLFSPDEYSSPEKEQAIARYEELIRRGGPTE